MFRPKCLISAGIPTTVTLSGMSFNTTAFAPIFTLSPIFIGPKTFAPDPTITLFPKSGCLLYYDKSYNHPLLLSSLQLQFPYHGL